MAIFDVIPNLRLRIYVKALGLTIHLGRWGNYYSFAVRLASDMLKYESSGLLVDGCEIDDLIDLRNTQGKYFYPALAGLNILHSI